MRLAYAIGNSYRGDPSGRTVHVTQFAANAIALGHELWTWGPAPLSGTRLLPASGLARLRALRRMDALYVRCADRPGLAQRLARPPQRQLAGSPLMAWEFNAAPEFWRLLGRDERAVARAIDDFRRLGRGCDLAICVSDGLAAYVRERFGIRHVIAVPNGSDPDLFRPDVPPVHAVERLSERLDVAWIGSLYLPWNDVDLLAAAASLVWEQDRGRTVAFHLLGQAAPGLMRDLPRNVRYHGIERYEMVPHWLAAMDVGLCLYRPGPADLNSPLKLFDYMASGLAVVGTAHPQMEQVFAELGQLDLLVPAGDPRALADVLLALGRDRERVQRQGRAGRQRVVEHYNWRRAARDALGAIEALRG